MLIISFDDSDRSPQSLALINQALAGMSLADVSINSSSGYLGVKTRYDFETESQRTYSYRYGFDHLELACEAAGDEEICSWQIDTQAYQRGEVDGLGTFQGAWFTDHPGQTMRTLIHRRLEDADAFVVLHHATQAPGE